MTSILIAMSGGVDSAVAALLTRDAGHYCEGVTMQLHSSKWGEAPAMDAAAVCRQLGIAHRVLDLREQFRADVICPFITGYLSGRTPNPCIDCNRQIKFGALIRYAREQGFERLVTGHYARISCDLDSAVSPGKVYRLLKARHAEKDQSYVLYQLGQSELAMLDFPLGEMSKDQVRQIAADAELTVAGKNESQDICFIERDYQSYIREQIKGLNYLTSLPKPGEIVDGQGNTLGYHQGVVDYTIGQRHGLGIAVGKRLYVTELDAVNNRVTVGEEADLLHRKVLLKSFSSPVPNELEPVITVMAKFRYRSIAAAADLVMFDDGRWEVQFKEPQKALTPGQAVVCYRGDQVVGGGIIDSVRV